MTHEALGTVRVMKTCGMMGEVVGRAASICIQKDCLPRDVYESHLEDLIELINLPGKAFRPSVNDKIIIPDDAMELAGPYGHPMGWTPKFPGVVDDIQAVFKGDGQGDRDLSHISHSAINTQAILKVLRPLLWKLQRLANMILELPINPTLTGENPFQLM